MDEKHGLRKSFLEAFVKELIINSVEETQLREIPKPTAPWTRTIESIKREMPQTREIGNLPIKPALQGLTTSKFKIRTTPQSHLLPIIPITKPKIPGKMMQPITQEMGTSKVIKRNLESFPRHETRPQPKSAPSMGSPDLGKLNSLMSDPRVESIECPGPNKNILVKKDGRMQRTKTVLTQEEVKKTITDFSDQTRIPLVGGTFKAALGNFIMTAIVSEFVGSRFIVQKKNPFQPLQVAVG